MTIAINPDETHGFSISTENEKAAAVRWLFRTPTLEDETFLLDMLEARNPGTKALAIIRRLCAGWEGWDDGPEATLKKGRLSDASIQAIPPAWRIGVADLAYNLLQRPEEDVEK